ncbi:hypothetical protein PanWU01x14_239500 [Parasponia andersonii]|uniref:Uncharacterized protein n=1 Tax=Parasponia andersonii TaxID=3476 RepID=A0A2P5BH83_PARAD|nr:hypothetical protein PanWU01x14_239500 [Parasponia andersonii]
MPNDMLYGVVFNLQLGLVNLSRPIIKHVKAEIKHANIPNTIHHRVQKHNPGIWAVFGAKKVNRGSHSNYLVLEAQSGLSSRVIVFHDPRIRGPIRTTK